MQPPTLESSRTFDASLGFRRIVRGHGSGVREHCGAIAHVGQVDCGYVVVHNACRVVGCGLGLGLG
jgi:hypothetical protein